MARPPANVARTPEPAALEEWPDPPSTFTDGERAAWERIGRAAMAGATMAACDLLMAEELARVMARIGELYADKDLKASTLKGWLDLQTKLLGELGLSPRSRKNTAKPKAPEKKNHLASVLE